MITAQNVRMSHSALDPETVSFTLADIAIEAGRLLRDLEGRSISHRTKEDGSPTTAADLAAEELIIARLRAFWPDIPVIAEETACTAAAGAQFFLVDPLDGTGDFMRGTGEYSVNIALIQGTRPVAAAIAGPALGKVWAAGTTSRAGHIPERPGGVIEWRDIGVRPVQDNGLVALVSRRHGDEATEACLATLPIGSRRAASSALKFCYIAEGEADVYVRCGPTMEWDTAAGDHIVAQAGGCVVGPGGVPLTYGHRDREYRNGPFAALGHMSLVARLSLPPKAA
jgi:3'(2'), 5'-bisphosphate nucleotidase